MSSNTSTKVFLGGSCNPTTWRADTAIPLLEKAGISYYNPQVDDWHQGLVEIEAKAKVNAETLLFVIDGQTRAIASMQEAQEYTLTGRKVVLVISDIPDGTIIDAQEVQGSELKDLNRGRAYLRNMASRYKISVYQTAKEAVESLIS